MGKRFENNERKTINREICNLREQGMSYRKIRKCLADNGIVISIFYIQDICVKKYGHSNKDNEKREDISEEKIYELRQQGNTYQEIVEYYKSISISVSYSLISRMCKKIYNQRGEEEPKVKKGKREENVSEYLLEDIYTYRNQGMTYAEIAQRCKESGYKYGIDKIIKLCKKIYAEKGEEIPKVEVKRNPRKIIIPENIKEEIYRLRNEGKSYASITKYIKEEMDFEISITTIRNFMGLNKKEDFSLSELKARLNARLAQKCKTGVLLEKYGEVAENSEKNYKADGAVVFGYDEGGQEH